MKSGIIKYKRKSCISLALCMMLVAAIILFPVTVTEASDNNTPVMSVSSTSGDKGTLATVNVELSASTDMAGGNFTISYDTSRLEVVKVSEGQLMKDTSFVFNPAYQGSKIRATWAGTSAVSQKGILAAITFRIKDAAQKGQALVSIESSSLYNVNSDPIPHLTSAGNITVNDGVPGDSTTTPTPPTATSPTTTPTPPATQNPSTNIGSQTTPPTAPVTDTGNSTQQGITDKGNGSSGTAATKVTNEQVTDAVQKAVSEEGNTTVELKASPSGGARDVALELPKTAVDTILKSEANSVKIDMGIATLTLDQKTLNSINTAALSEASDAKVDISVARVDTSSVLQKYSGQAKKDFQDKIGDRPVYDFTIQAGSTKVSDFKGGIVNIRLPYIPKAGENTDAIVIYNIGDDGSLKCVSNGRYDPETKIVTLGLSHFSRYAIGYNAVKFADVPSSTWYNKAVGYLAARNICNRGSDGKFAPLKNITRADFLVMVMKAYGIEPDSQAADNFADAGNNEYTPYLAAAKRLGLVTGNNNRFSPGASITRQDLFVILYRALGKLGKLPEGKSDKSFSSFKDTGSIASYAKDAMKLFAESGITSGDGKNLNPKMTTTRAQAAQILYNLLT